MIRENIKQVESKLKELENLPCCFDFSFDNSNRLTVILPEGFKYNSIAQGFRLNEGSKIKNIIKAIEICENVWGKSMMVFNK